METVLIVTATQQSQTSLHQLLKDFEKTSVDFASGGAEARRMFSEREYDLVIVNTPLRDEFGDMLASDIAEDTSAGVLLLVRNEIELEIEHKLAGTGVFVLGKPLSRQFFLKAVRLLEATKIRMSGIKKENIKLQKKIEDIRTINRAKYVLIECLSMTEPQAHRYLERQAMDLRLTKIEVAKHILSTYEH